MEKIKLLFTGGTIGSLAKGNNINTDVKSRYILLEKYENNTSRFDIDTPLNILSENLNYENWTEMIIAIKKALNEDNKGIILTHGSDTLAYSAAFLGLFFYDSKKPIVLVASNKILTDENSNGAANFKAAVKFIDNYTKGGVFVAYRNLDEKRTNIHLGTRMMEPYHFSDNFYSVENKTFAVVEEDKLIFKNDFVPEYDQKWNFKLSFRKRGVMIRPFAGLDYKLFMNAGNKPDFVLHDLYHSGTSSTGSTKHLEYKTSLIEYAQFCKENNIDLYLSNIREQDVNYDSTNQLLKYKIKPVYDMLTNVAMSKLTIAYNFLDKKDRMKFLSTNVAGEKIKEV